MRLVATGERQSAGNAIKNPSVNPALLFTTAQMEIGQFDDAMADT